MKKIFFIFTLIMCSQLFASVRVTDSDGIVKLYKFNHDHIEIFSCGLDSGLSFTSDDELIEICNENRKARYTSDFFTLANQTESKYFIAEYILSSEEVKNYQKQIHSIEFIDREVLLSLEQEIQLTYLRTKLEHHYDAILGRDAFQRAILAIKEKMSSAQIESIKSSDIEYTALSNLSLSELDVRCGEEGSLHERIRNCSIYTSSSIDSFTRVLKANDYTEIYQDNETGDFWGRYLESAEDYNQLTNRPWRWSLELEQQKLPVELQNKLFQTTSLAILGIDDFQSTAKSKEGSTLSVKFESGMIYFNLNRDGKHSLLKKLNLSEKPLKLARNNLPLKKNRFRYVHNLWESQITMNEYLMQQMKAGYFILFPVPIIAHAGYSFAYAPGVLVDLFGKKSHAFRSIKKLLKGQNIEVSEKVFVEMEAAIKQMHF